MSRKETVPIQWIKWRGAGGVLGYERGGGRFGIGEGGVLGYERGRAY